MPLGAVSGPETQAYWSVRARTIFPAMPWPNADHSPERAADYFRDTVFRLINALEDDVADWRKRIFRLTGSPRYHARAKLIRDIPRLRAARALAADMAPPKPIKPQKWYP